MFKRGADRPAKAGGRQGIVRQHLAAFAGTVRRLVRLVDVFHAANCALWLLEQKELRPLIEGDWGDPEAVRDMLRKAGCVPKCGREWALKPNHEDHPNSVLCVKAKKGGGK